MSLEYRSMPPRVVGREVRPVGASCDACGADAWHSAHRRPIATLGRVEDGARGNMDYWELDLCAECKDAVMATLRTCARAVGRVLPDTREESFPPP